MRPAALNKASSALPLIACAVFLFLVPVLLSSSGSELGLAVLLIFSFTLAPLCCLLVTMRAASRGVPAILALIPPPLGAALGFLVIRMYPPRGSLLLCFVLSLLGGAIGQERYKRARRAG